MNLYISPMILDRYLFGLTIVQVIFALVAIAANLCFGVNLIFRKKLRDQTQILLLNISIVDFSFGVLYLYHCIIQFVFSIDEAPYRFCIKALVPFVWLSIVLPCLSIIGVRARMVQVTAYGDTTGGQITSEPWKMTVSLVFLWTASLIGTIMSFSFETLLPLSLDSCLFPLTVGRGVLVPYFLFTSCATLLLLFEYGRIIVHLLFGGDLNNGTNHHHHDDDDDKFSISLDSFNYATIDKKLIRNIIVVVGLYMGCWVPMHFIVFFCLHNYQQNHANKLTKALVHFVWILPVLHSAISPLIYFSLDADMCKLRPRAPRKKRRSGSVHDGIVVSMVTLALPSIVGATAQTGVERGLTNHGYASDFM